ncbi:hypothetical protein [Proteiniphilum sp. X52]|uniref:hypothetical protein n=1 Tax=Proteiniphilum sp. X52 TaxID=2382159 RepID=UPI0011CE6E89|nr:hypothetical protein [Proteiniphilum sp. X52]
MNKREFIKSAAVIAGATALPPLSLRLLSFFGVSFCDARQIRGESKEWSSPLSDADPAVRKK